MSNSRPSDPTGKTPRQAAGGEAHATSARVPASESSSELPRLLADLGGRLDESMGAIERARRDMEEQHQRTMQQSAEHAEKLMESLASRLQDTLVSIAENFERKAARTPHRRAAGGDGAEDGKSNVRRRKEDEPRDDDDDDDSSDDDRGDDDDGSGDDGGGVRDVIIERAEEISAADRLRAAAATRPYGAVFAQHIAPAAHGTTGRKLVDVNPKHRRRAAALDMLIAEQDGHPLDRVLGRASEDAENLRRLVRDLESHDRDAWSPSMSRARDAQGLETEWPKIKGANDKTNTHVRKLLQPVGTMLMQAEQVQRAAIIAIATGTVFNSLEDALDALWLARQAMVSCWALLDYDYSLRAAEALPQQVAEVARTKLMEKAARVANPHLDARRREEQRCAREDAILATAFGAGSLTAYQAGHADGARKQAKKDKSTGGNGNQGTQHGGGGAQAKNNYSKASSHNNSNDNNNSSNNSNSTTSTSTNNSSSNSSKNSKNSNNNIRKTDNKAGAADAAPASG